MSKQDERDRATAVDRDAAAEEEPDRDETARQSDPATMQPPGPDAGPDRPTQLGKRSWWAAIKRTVREFRQDNLTDWAAALTYYAVLSIFPGMLVLVSLVGLLDDSATEALLNNLKDLVPQQVHEILTGAIDNLKTSKSSGWVALVGLAVALWSASGYVAAFMRASNAVYEVPEGRPIWKTLPVRLGVTVLTGLLLIVSSVLVVFTGRVAEKVGDALGIGTAFVRVWDIAKWPVLVLLVSLMIAVLYWASPNARQAGFRWITVGSLTAVVLWIIASVGFSVYVANFSSYNKTYGALGGVIIFFIWLWITNIAVLFGAELDAELERERVATTGYPPDREPFLQLRDDRKVKAQQDKELR